MATQVQGKAPIGSLQKPPPREKKQPKPLKRTEMKPRTTPLPPAAKPLNQFGKAAKGRKADKVALKKLSPATHEGLHFCYIGAHWVAQFDLEHVIDASLRPDLARDPRNHKKACNAHNIAKKNGTLTMDEEIRVQNAIEEVLHDDTIPTD